MADDMAHEDQLMAVLAASDRAACLEWCFAELCFVAVQWCDMTTDREEH